MRLGMSLHRLQLLSLRGKVASSRVRSYSSQSVAKFLRDHAAASRVRAMASSALVPPGVTAPVAVRKAVLLEKHGDVREDPYYWMRDDKRTEPAVIQHLEAENAYTKAVMSDTEELQTTLYNEMRGRIKEDDVSAPIRRGNYYYYTKTAEGQQYKVHCRRKVPPNAPPPNEAEVMDESVPEEVLLDENARKESGGHTFYMVDTVRPSPNHQLLAWTEDVVGGEKYNLHVKDLSTGEEKSVTVPNTSGSVVWADDNTTLFYVLKDHLERPYKIMRHKLGTQVSDDVVVFEDLDDAFFINIDRSHSDTLLLIHAGSAVTSEVSVIPANAHDTPPRVVLPRTNDVEYSVDERYGQLFILYRDKQRPNSELWVAPLSDPQNHKVLLPHSPAVKLQGVVVGAAHLAVFARVNGLQRATVYDLPPQGQDLPPALPEGRVIAFEEPAYELEAGAQGDFTSPVLRLAYTSLRTPLSTIDYNCNTGARAVKKVSPVLGGFDKENYVTDRVWATAKDGVKVPISLVYRKDMVKLDGSAPMLLNGYGSYEICNDPYFKSDRLSLLDRGWVFGIAHVRGGGEMGRAWYENGKYLHKKNTITDFIACAEHVIALHYTSADQLCVEGRSAGGIVIGGSVNERPDLFCGAIMGVPFVDVLTSMLDESIPLTIIEWEEWGNPNNKEFYDYMKSYAPYENVKSQVYPHLLLQAGLHDPRVAYWEVSKMTAKLRHHSPPSPERLLLLKTELGAGHFSVTGRFERLKEVALEYAFLLKATGRLGPQPKV